MDYGISYFVFLFLFVLEIFRRSNIFRRIVRMPWAVFRLAERCASICGYCPFCLFMAIYHKKTIQPLSHRANNRLFFSPFDIVHDSNLLAGHAQIQQNHPMASLHFIHSAIFCKRLAASPIDVGFSAVCCIRGYEFCRWE